MNNFYKLICVCLHMHDYLMNRLIKIPVNSANTVHSHENYIFQKEPYPIYSGHPLKKSVFWGGLANKIVYIYIY